MIGAKGAFGCTFPMAGRCAGSPECADAAITDDLIEYVCGSEEEQEHFARWVAASVRQLLTSHWDWVEAVAAALLERRTLTVEEVRELDPRGAAAGIRFERNAAGTLTRRRRQVMSEARSADRRPIPFWQLWDELQTAR